MTVYKKKNGKWYCRFQVKGERRHVLCDGAKSSLEAKAIEDAEKFKLRQQLSGLLPQTDKKQKKHTINLLIKNYLDYSKQHKKTYDKDLLHCTFFKDYFGEEKDITTIRQKDIRKLQADLKSRPTARGICRENATVNRYIASLKKAFSILVNDEDIDININPCKGIAMLVEDNRRTTYLPEHLQNEFLSYLPDMVRDMVLLDLNTGLRTANILNANITQFDLNLGIWTITKKDNKGKKYIRIKLNNIALEVVKKYHYKTDYYLFTNSQTGKPLTTYRKSFKAAAVKIGIPDLQPKDIRRSAGTILYQKGVSLRVIKDVLHHSNVATTERYLGITAQELDNAYETLCNNNKVTNSYNEDFIQKDKWTQNGHRVIPNFLKSGAPSRN